MTETATKPTISVENAIEAIRTLDRFSAQKGGEQKELGRGYLLMVDNTDSVGLDCEKGMTYVQSSTGEVVFAGILILITEAIMDSGYSKEQLLRLIGEAL